MPLISQRLRIPDIIGLILAGIIFGPHLTGVLDRDPTIILFSTVGLLYILMLAGIEIDLHEFSRSRHRSITFGGLTFFFPQILGTLIALWFLGYGWATAILLASMFASHTPIVYPVISRLGLAKRESVTISLGGTIITDTAALMILAVIAAQAQDQTGSFQWIRLIVSLPVFMVVVLWGAPLLSRWFFRNVGGNGGAEFLFALAVVFGAASFAHFLRLEPIIGAFFAGLAINRSVPEQSTLMNRLQFFGHYFFIPLFLISVGMLVNLGVLVTDFRAWLVAVTMTVAVVSTKWIAAQTTRHLFGYTWEEGWLIFSLSVSQAAATLAAVLVGYQLGIFDDAILNGAILMILVTCLIAPWAADRYGRRLAIQEAEASLPSGPIPQRILVPVANPATMVSLIDFAVLLRGKTSTQPVYPMNVVVDEGDVRTLVARSEKMVSQGVMHAVAMEIPVFPVIRLDVNAVNSILRAVRELQITSVVMGWRGQVGARERIFGSLFDHLLDQCQERIFVCKIDHSLNNTQRVILALPPLVEYERDFDAIVSDIKSLTKQVGAELHVVYTQTVGGGMEDRIKKMHPKIPVDFLGYSSWQEARKEMRTLFVPDDLLIFLSVREGSVAWQPGLDRLPRMITTWHPWLSMVTIYPSMVREDVYRPEQIRSTRLSLEHVPEPGGISVALDGFSFSEAIRRMLTSAFEGYSSEIENLHQILMSSAEEFTVELTPGVLLLHAHDVSVPFPSVLIGLSRQGIVVPKMENPVHVITIVLGFRDQSPEQHLRVLADIARLMRNPDMIQELKAASSEEEAMTILSTEAEIA